MVSLKETYKYSMKSSIFNQRKISFEMLHFLLIWSLCSSIVSGSSHTESIMELYKKINEKGSLVDGLALNSQAQLKLKTINTIRLLPLNSSSAKNPSSFIEFKINLSKLHDDEDVKLIELRLKLSRKKIEFNKRKLPIIHRFNSKKSRFYAWKISTNKSEYFSFDLTDQLIRNKSEQWLMMRKRHRLIRNLDQASLIIYSRVPGVFLLPPMTKRTKRSTTINDGPCSRRDFFVDFDQLSFGSWVIEPKQFNAGVCRGDCPNPLSRSFFPTNHAMLLSLLHERGRTNQQPSCVPVRLRPLDLLYYDHRELIIKRHQSMQVEECGCR